MSHKRNIVLQVTFSTTYMKVLPSLPLAPALTAPCEQKYGKVSSGWAIWKLIFYIGRVKLATKKYKAQNKVLLEKKELDQVLHYKKPNS